MKHVVFFDNGQDYEDNRCTPVCIAPDGTTATRVVKQLTAWLSAAQERFPRIDDYAMESDAWLDAEDKRRDAIKRIRCPYGHGEMREGVQYHQGRFYANAVPDANLL